MLKDLFRFLSFMRRLIPPNPAAHRIYMDENGELFIDLFIGDVVIPVKFEQSDYDKNPEQLALEISNIPAVAKAIKTFWTTP